MSVKLSDDLSIIRWRFNGPLNRPSAFNSCGYGGTTDSNNFSPLGECFYLPVKGYKARISFISSLFFRSGPPAIIPFIAHGIINAIKGRICRSFPHVFKKIPEIHPSITDFYFPKVIMFLWIGASILHGIPRIICRRTAHAVPKIFSAFIKFYMKTPARFYPASPNVSSAQNLKFSALALHPPVSVAINNAFIFDKGKP